MASSSTSRKIDEVEVIQERNYMENDGGPARFPECPAPTRVMKRRLIPGALAAALTLAVPSFLFVTSPPSFPAPRSLASARTAARVETRSSSVLLASAALVVLSGSASLRAGRPRGSSVQAQAFASQPAGVTPAGSIFAGATTGAEREESRIPRRMLMPKNVKWRKPHKPPVKPFDTNRWKFKGNAWRGNKPYFGKYALQILEEAWINPTNIEACRRMMVRTTRKDGGKVWLRVFPHSAITWRGKETRMGGGKGTIQYWVQAVRPGFILFELDGCTEATAHRAFNYCSRYLPFKTKMLVKDTPSRFELGLAGGLKSKKHIPKEFLKKTD